MRLTIITVNLNNREGLQRTVDSVIGQTFKDYEWIVIDGGSTDGSRELIEQYADRFAYWCSEPDGGIYNAMNKGIAHAKGEWLLFLNSGDWLHNDHVLECVFSEERHADILYGNVFRHGVSCESIPRSKVMPEQISMQYLYENVLCHQSTFYKRVIFDGHTYDETYRICADWVFTIDMMLKGRCFEYLPFHISHIVEDGISAKMEDKLFEERQRAWRTHVPQYIQSDIQTLESYVQRDKELESHKLYRLIMKSARMKIRIARKAVGFIERIRTEK